jgi:Fe-S cluster assembly protein SufD
VKTSNSHFGAQFARCESELANASPRWLAPIRRAAIERFDELGLPTRKDEAWKYTPTSQIAKSAFSLPSFSSAAASPATESRLSRESIVRTFGEPTAEHSLVFADGRFAPSLSSTQALPDSLEASSLAELLRDDPERVRVLARGADSLTRPFAALNLAFVHDGAFVSVGAGRAEQSIELIFVTTRAAEGCITNLRNLIHVEAGASAVISMRYAVVSDTGSHGTLPDSDTKYLTNAVTSIELGENATLDLVSVQREAEGALHLSSIDVEQRRDSRFRSHLFAIGAKLSRCEVNAVLGAPGADCELNGLFLVGGSQHVDNQTLIDHASPHGTSRELYKGVLGGRSRGVFNGLVRVRADAQKTSAKQSNPNLLVSDRAHVNTKPTLEINADDVKCSHGSTVGRLDEDALFYLRARGIDKTTATQMLVGAFASEITQAIPLESLRAGVQQWITEKLAAVTNAEAA